MFSPEYVGNEQEEPCRQACDQKLVDREDVFQRVDPLLHGTGVEVVIDASSDAPQRPHCVQHQRHVEADREAQLQRSGALCQRLQQKTNRDLDLTTSNGSFKRQCQHFEMELPNPQ